MYECYAVWIYKVASSRIAPLCVWKTVKLSEQEAQLFAEI